MCVLLKLNYAKFGVSNLSCSKAIEEKSLGRGRLDPIGTGRVKKEINGSFPFIRAQNVSGPLIVSFKFRNRFTHLNKPIERAGSWGFPGPEITGHGTKECNNYKT